MNNITFSHLYKALSLSLIYLSIYLFLCICLIRFLFSNQEIIGRNSSRLYEILSLLFFLC